MDDAGLIGAMLSAGVAHCRVVVAEHGSVLASLFLAGLVGSASHCVGMCGPFVLAQTAARLQAIPADAMRERHRLQAAALLPYHLGRATTYILIGTLAAALTDVLADAVGGLRIIAAGLMVLAAVLFIGYAIPAVRVVVPLASGPGLAVASALERAVKPWIADPSGWRGYALGVALGFLPCGLLYGAVAAAASAADPLAGGFGMAAFSLGTVPALVGIGLLGQAAWRRFRAPMRRAVPVLMIVNAAVLTWFAVALVA